MDCILMDASNCVGDKVEFKTIYKKWIIFKRSGFSVSFSMKVCKTLKLIL